MPPEYKIANRVVYLRPGSLTEATTWPWPFSDDDRNSPAWKARYAPAQLTQTDLFELASIAEAYSTMITHPCRSVADTIHDLRRVMRAENKLRTLGIPRAERPEPAGGRECTCLGSCRGADSLAAGWHCALSKR